jgi:hypothetical protein
MKKNKMSHVKDLLITMSISLSLGVLLNVLYYNVRGRYWFVLMNPLKKAFYETVSDVTFSTVVYLLIGAFIWSIIWLYNSDKFGFTFTNFIHFIISFFTFILLYLYTFVPFNPFNTKINEISYITAYFNNTFIFWDLVKPVLWIISSYIIIWGIFWIMQYKQVKKMNKEFNK